MNCKGLILILILSALLFNSESQASEILTLDQLETVNSLQEGKMHKLHTQLTTFKSSNISKIGLRFTGEESDSYITECTYFLLLFTDVRMIELPNGKEQLVIKGLEKAKVNRTDVFLSYKMNFMRFGIEETRTEIGELFKRTGLEYIDLFFIHYMDTQGFFLETWKSMIDLKHQGKIRYLGLCNTYDGYIDYLFQHTGILPSVVQLEINPFFQQKFLAEKFQNLGITVQTYSTLAAGERMYEPRLQRLSKKYDLTVSQLLLKWCLQNGYSCLMTSRRLHRIAENAYISSSVIQDEDIEVMNDLDSGHSNHFDPSDFEQLEKIDHLLQDKINEATKNGDMVVAPVRSHKYVSLPMVIEQTQENSTEDTLGDNINQEDMFDPPMFMSTDLNTNINSVDKAPEENNADNARMSNENSKYNENDLFQSAPFQVEMKDLASTCKRLTKEHYDQAMKEMEKLKGER